MLLVVLRLSHDDKKRFQLLPDSNVILIVQWILMSFKNNKFQNFPFNWTESSSIWLSENSKFPFSRSKTTEKTAKNRKFFIIMHRPSSWEVEKHNSHSGYWIFRLPNDSERKFSLHQIHKKAHPKLIWLKNVF